MKILSSLTFISILAAANSFASPGEWKKMGSDDGVDVYKMETPGSRLLAFKGVGVIDAPLWKVFSIMADEKRDPEWVDDLEDMHVVRVISPLERIEYNHIGTPFIIKDRDFVIDVKVIPHQLNHDLDVVMHSVKEPLAPETRYVRGEIVESTFSLVPIEGDTKVKVTCEVQVDPKGNIPAWLVNLIQKGWPHNTIEKLRKQAMKTDIIKTAGYEKMWK